VSTDREAPSIPNGLFAPYDPADKDSYITIRGQLLDNKKNIEYVATNLEAGALRANAIGLTPSAFNSATWHLAGVQKDEEIRQAGWSPGGAATILQNMPIALAVWGLNSVWSLNNEPQYHYWDGR
jgi:hypothetical protein